MEQKPKTQLTRTKQPTEQAHSRRKNAAEHYRYFFEESEPLERFPLLAGLRLGQLLKLD